MRAQRHICALAFVCAQCVVGLAMLQLVVFLAFRWWLRKSSPKRRVRVLGGLESLKTANGQLSGWPVDPPPAQSDGILYPNHDTALTPQILRYIHILPSRSPWRSRISSGKTEDSTDSTSGRNSRSHEPEWIA